MNRISQTIPYQYDTGFSPYKAAELDTALSELHQNGFTGVEFAVCYPEQVDADEMNRKAEKNHLAVTSLSTGQIVGRDKISLTDANEEGRLRTQKVLMGHIDLSERVGLPPVTIGLMRGKGESADKAWLWSQLVEVLLPCVDYAAKKGVRLQMEPIRRAEVGFIHTIADGMELIRRLGNPENMGILYDTFHVYNEDGDQLEAIKTGAGHIMNVHFADSGRGLPGSGTLDFKAIYRAILDTGYQGAFALETEQIPSIEYVRAHYAESMLAIMK